MGIGAGTHKNAELTGLELRLVALPVGDWRWAC